MGLIPEDIEKIEEKREKTGKNWGGAFKNWGGAFKRSSKFPSLIKKGT
jgi:hypothetical protein